MPVPTVAELAQALAAAFVTLAPDEQRLAATAYRLLASGQPVAPDALAAAAAWPPQEVEARLEAWPGVYRDDTGRLAGFWGLATEAVTGERVEFDGVSGWAWCAFDPLFIAPLLGAEARVDSACPQSGEPVRLVVTPEGVRDLEPAEAVVSFLLPDGPFDADVRATFCHFVHFLASPAAGDAWTAEHPGTFWVPVADAFEVARRLNSITFPAVMARA